jgi:hypothetical protein
VRDRGRDFGAVLDIDECVIDADDVVPGKGQNDIGSELTRRADDEGPPQKLAQTASPTGMSRPRFSATSREARCKLSN